MRRRAGFWLKPKDAKFLDGLPEPEKLPPWLTEADLDYFVSEFERTGFRGGLNRYRNMDRDWEELPQLAGAKVQQPALFIAGERDGVIAMNPSGIETHEAERAQPARRDPVARRGPLDAAGAAEGSQRGTDQVPEGVVIVCVSD